ncbi:unnamed protein product, partial [Nesidiocoris tenuis]
MCIIECIPDLSGTNTIKLITTWTTHLRKSFKDTNSTYSTRISSIRARRLSIF